MPALQQPEKDTVPATASQ